MYFNNDIPPVLLDLVAPAIQKVEHDSNDKGMMVKQLHCKHLFYNVHRIFPVH